MPKSELIGSILSIQLNAIGFGLAERARGLRDGEILDLGTHKLRFGKRRMCIIGIR